MNISRRHLLTSTAGATVLSGISGALLAHRYDNSHSVIASPQFYGEHQSGIMTMQPACASYVAYDCTAHKVSELKDAFKVITRRCAALMAGYTPSPVGITAPPSDSGTLGMPVPSDYLTITLGMGYSLFDERYGLTSARPRYLTHMPVFANDDLQPQYCHGDILLVFKAHHPDTLGHALRDINKHTNGIMRMRWKQDGFLAPARSAGTPRNHFGFKDGIANPDITDTTTARTLIWAADNDQKWTQQGTYCVIRLISMLTEFWDRISLTEQENIIGRTRLSGAPLDGNHETDTPQYLDDPTGAAIPLNSHIRLANPRDPQSDNSRIYRQSYNYSNGITAQGNLDMGLIFSCYQQNIAQQFETIQLRLRDEPLTDYVIPYGGGYFFLPPGVHNSNDYFAKKLFTITGS